MTPIGLRPLVVLLALGASLASAAAQVPPVYVPEMGLTPAERPRMGSSQVYVPEMGGPPEGRRFPDRIEVPRAPPPPAARRRATVPSPTNPAMRIEVPDTVRRGETSQDRIARCQHYGTLFGVPDSQRGSYINRCAF